MKCSVDGCDRKYSCKGFCNMHYQRILKHGSPGGLDRERKTERGEPLKWLLGHVNYDGEGCLQWPFADDGHGYGQFFHNGKTIKAHRFMCAQVKGEPSFEKAEAAHTCGRGKMGCVDPRHLRWSTSKENNWDRTIHGTDNRGERCGSNILAENDVINVVSLLNGGRSQHSVAEEYGVHRSAIACIAQGRTWSWLTGISHPDNPRPPVPANDNEAVRAAA